MFRFSAVFSLIAALALISSACATSKQEEPPPAPTPVARPAPPPAPPKPVPAAPAPAPMPVAKPMRLLPETAGSLPLVGLAGASALGLAGLLRGVRRWLL